MRILLVQPTTKYPDRKVLRSRKRWLLGITLPYLAGLTPREVMVDLADDRLVEIPYHRQYDLVGITSTCATAERAYEIAVEFRRRRVPVVMGGFHVPCTRRRPWSTAMRWWWERRRTSGSKS